MAQERCTICATRKENCVNLNDKVFHQDLSTAIVNLCSIEIKSLLVGKGLVCPECAMSIFQANSIIDKVRLALSKLKKRKPRRSVKQDTNGEQSFANGLENQLHSTILTPDIKSEADSTMNESKLKNLSVSSKSISIIKSNFQKECPNCGLNFRTKHKYESHYFGEKCKTAIYPCQNPKCNRRFNKVVKMRNHMEKAHPNFENDDLQQYCLND